MMDLGRYSLAVAIATTVTVLLASILIWLLIAEPVALATAVGDGDFTALARAVGNAIVAGFQALARYL
jgi:Na+-driven multidrug efflux pump